MDMITDTEPVATKKVGFFAAVGKVTVGGMPLLAWLLLTGVVVVAIILGKLPKDMIGGFALIMALGALLGELGQRIPILNRIGGAAILSLFVPSAMVFYGILGKQAVDVSNFFMKGAGGANFLYIYISVLVCGSILSMNRRILVQGFIRILVPLIVGSIAAIGMGMLVGIIFGYNPIDTYLYIVTPIIGGGIGEGILPLSIGYSQITGQAQDAYVAKLIPAALLGNVVAIIMAGILARAGEKFPKANGRGLLVRTGNDNELLALQNMERPVDFQVMGAGMLVACGFFIFGIILSAYIGIPGPIIMILAAVLLKAFNLMPQKLENGAYNLYKLMTGAFTYPLLVGLGIGFVPWKDMIASFTIPYFTICAMAVLALIAGAYLVAKVLKMFEIDTAIVTSCHAGLGGTGAVAILSASDRMNLMPFAQVATRIGGACLVIAANFILKAIHG